MKIFDSMHAGAFAFALIAGSAFAPSARAQKLFWSDYDAGGNGLVQNLPIPVSGVPNPLNATKTHDVAIDTANQVLYWTDNQLGVGYVMRGLATGGPGTIVASGIGSAWKVGYIKDNSNNEWVYWTDISANDLVYRKNITTGAPNQLLPMRSLFGIALDKRTNQQKLYTVDPTTAFVVRSDLDGLNAVAFSTTAWDTGSAVRVDGMCIDTVNNRLWAVGVTDVSHPGPTQSWVKFMNLSTGVISPFLTSPLGQGDPVGVINTFMLADIAYDCVSNEVYWTSYDLNGKSTIRKSTIAAVWSIYYTPPGAYYGRYEGLAIDANAPCSRFNQICAGHFGTGTLACPCGNVSTTNPNAGCVSSLGVGGEMNATGVSSLSADTLVLLCDSMPNGPALYFEGTTPQNSGEGVAFGDGLLCLGGTITRLGVKFASGGGSSYPLPGVDLPISVQANIAAGDSRYYQAWYRDGVVAYCTAATYNLSNGMKVEWGP